MGDLLAKGCAERQPLHIPLSRATTDKEIAVQRRKRAEKGIGLLPPDVAMEPDLSLQLARRGSLRGRSQA